MTTTFIEKDALKSLESNYGTSLVDAGAFTAPHEHASLKSFIAMPRHDPTLMQRLRSLFKSELKPGQYITEGADGLRTMFIITSNSYEDRDDETITSEALKAYESSCFPGEGLFHCDNPLLFWHDDDVPMGEIIAVNYSEPFLVEVAKELPTPTARVLWDYAEANGDKAGASHRFGYRDEDRQADGSYTRILKQETSYLPERHLAANLMTYAGVIDKTMSTPQSDAWLDKVFSAATGGKIQEAAAMVHAKSGKLDAALEKLGITHKSKKAKAEGDEEAEVTETEDSEVTESPEEEVKAVSLADIRAYLGKVDRVIAMMEEMSGAQDSMLTDMENNIDATEALAKAFAAQKTAQKSAADDLEQRVRVLEARLKMTPRKASADPETTLTVAELKALHEQAEKASTTTHPAFGVQVDPSKSPFKKNGTS